MTRQTLMADAWEAMCFKPMLGRGLGVLLTTDPSYSLLKTKAIFSGCSVHFLEHLLADHTLGSHLLQ